MDPKDKTLEEPAQPSEIHIVPRSDLDGAVLKLGDPRRYQADERQGIRASIPDLMLLVSGDEYRIAGAD